MAAGTGSASSSRLGEYLRCWDSDLFGLVIGHWWMGMMDFLVVFCGCDGIRGDSVSLSHGYLYFGAAREQLFSTAGSSFFCKQ
jgi:hypothetical protein